MRTSSCPEEERPYENYGEWAEDTGLGRDASVTVASLGYGSVSFRGAVVPSALQAVRVTGDTVATALLRPDSSDSGQWDHLPVGLALS